MASLTTEATETQLIEKAGFPGFVWLQRSTRTEPGGAQRLPQRRLCNIHVSLNHGEGSGCPAIHAQPLRLSRWRQAAQLRQDFIEPEGVLSAPAILGGALIGSRRSAGWRGDRLAAGGLSVPDAAPLRR
jgi:hypothetical protein